MMSEACKHEANNNESFCVHCGFVAEEMLRDQQDRIASLEAELEVEKRQHRNLLDYVKGMAHQANQAYLANGGEQSEVK